MFQNASKVLVVDNDLNDLNRIKESLHSIGLPSYCYHYIAANPPKVPTSGIRLAFFDIKLFDGAGNDKLIITSLVNALKQFLSKDNGPYVLIFWTSNSGLIEDAKKYIDERENGNIISPILIDCIDKNYGLGDPDGLQKRLIEILSLDIVELLFDYEAKVAQAAGNTLGTIFKVASNSIDSWGERTNFDENFDPLFSKISFETLGYEQAKLYPSQAVRDGLNPILINELNNIELTSKWENKLTKLIGTSAKHEFRNIGLEFQCKLNSIYHYDFNIERRTKTDRGTVLEMIADDEILNTLFGMKKQQLCHLFLPFKKDYDKKLKKQIRSSIRLVLLEISAACDFAQNNPRNHIYILGLLSPLFDMNNALMPKSDSIISLPFFEFNHEDCCLLFNSRYTISSVNASEEYMGDIQFQIKQDLLNSISSKYSNYVSRLGLISF